MASLLCRNSLLTIYLLVCLIYSVRSFINELGGIVFEIISVICDKAITGLSFIMRRFCLPDLSYSRCLFKMSGLSDSIEGSRFVAIKFVTIWDRSTKPLLSIGLLTFIGFPSWLFCLVFLVLSVVVVWLILVYVSYPTIVRDNIYLVFSATHWGRIILRLAPRVRSALHLIFRTSLHFNRCICLRFQQHCWIGLFVNKLVMAHVFLRTNIFISTSCQRFSLIRVFFLLESDCLPMLCEVRF